MPTDWNLLRAWNGSVEKGFEELCCQLAADEAYPPLARFTRKGTPDAGVEAFWSLADGGEHAWQAKFFLSPPSTGQWRQIDESVKAAIHKHPSLRRLTLCLPIDRSDARVPGASSFLAKWHTRVRTWSAWARKRGMSVLFDYWGEHELAARMSLEKNRGRYWFWFSREQFTLQWFRRKLNVAIENAGERYTPVLHVDLPIARRFTALGRTPEFYKRLNTLYQEMRQAADRFNPRHLGELARGEANRVFDDIGELSHLLDIALRPLNGTASAEDLEPISWAALVKVSRSSLDRLGQTQAEFGRLIDSRRQTRPDPKNPGTLRDLEEDSYYCRALEGAIVEIIDFCEGNDAVLANNPAMLLVGEAGQGKTHLLCDIADRDLRQGRPRVLLHGFHFVDGEPWAQIVQGLGLSCSRDQFLGGLEAAAQAFGCRILLLIDALNEGEGRVLWAKYLRGMLAEIRERPWIGLAVSVRTSYEQLVVPEDPAPMRLTRVVHRGFQEHEYEAVNRFFQHFGIQPTIPLLVPEFTNPLFLKLFCQGVKSNGWTHIPPGIRGITSILEMFLSAVNEKLWKPERMDYDRASDPVRKAVDAVVALMARNGRHWVPRDIGIAAVNQVHPVGAFEKSLFHNLISEGVLAENRWVVDGKPTEFVSLAYERFADHLLAKQYLDVHLSPRGASRAFSPRTAVGKMLRDESRAWRAAGLIDALCIHLPERIGRELFELVPSARDFRPLVEGFVRSLVWRDSKAFTKATFGRIETLLGDQYQRADVLNATLTVIAVPDHPLNARRLHTVLSRFTMAGRDAWWSVFLHHEWGKGRALDRIVDWVFSETQAARLPPTVVDLLGTGLSWFLTSANRFVRDRSTKAIVQLYENRVDLYLQLLNRFWEVNDPYVLERLLAAGYGSALRSIRLEGLRQVAEAVAFHVFGRDRIVPQILTRDHARGIIELAEHRGVIAPGALEPHRPTYRSKWPNMAVPSRASLEKWGEQPKDGSRAAWARWEIYNSISAAGYSDFSRYVIGDLDEWTSVRLGRIPPKTKKERYESFLRGLKPGEAKAVKAYEVIVQRVKLARALSAERRREVLGHEVTDRELTRALLRAERAALSTLRRPGQRQAFQSSVKPYFERPHERPNAFDQAFARRWMIQRVIDYGWTAERFGEFDRSVNLARHGREANKAERIGKKYQWIAFHEMLARLSDNFYIRRERYNDDRLVEYAGPWQLRLGFSRDIDPSVILRRTKRESDAPNGCWWSPFVYANSKAPALDVEWIRTSDDLPSLAPLLIVRDAGGIEWAVLDTHVDWDQSARPGRKAYEEKRRQVWYWIRSYLVRRPDADRFYRWAKRQDFMGRWMPEPGHFYHVHLSEYPWASAFRAAFEPESWVRGWGNRTPVEVGVTAIDFLYESGGFDCSLDETIGITLPAPSLVKGMDLHAGRLEGQFLDSSDQVVAFDPSVRDPGARALLIRRDALQRYLSEHGVELFWTVLGEKQFIGGGYTGAEGWLQTSGVFRMTKGTPKGHLSSEYRTRARERSKPKARRASRAPSG